MKKSLALSMLVLLLQLKAHAQVFQDFDYGTSMNWSDCISINIYPGMDMCPAFPSPYPSLTTVFNYQDPVAMAEVVPDPWQSFLYKESFFDFSSKNVEKTVTGAGAVSTMGAGYGNQKKASGGKEFIGKHRYDTHIWAVSDIWRLKTSNFLLSCFSLTCKTEDWGCKGVLNSSTEMGADTENMIQSMNNNESADGKGQGYEDSNGDVRYEDGSVYSENTDMDGNPTGGYHESRPAGNYGAGGNFASAGTQAGGSGVPGQSSAISSAGGFDYSSVASGAAGIGTSMATSAITNKFGGAVGSAVGTGASAAGSYGNFAGNGQSLPSSTTKGISPSEPSALNTAGSSSSMAGNQVSDNAMGNNNPGNQQAASQMQSQIPGAGDMGGDGFSQALAMIDRVVYFNPMEQAIQMIATQSPIMLSPVFMTERHGKASADGGFFLSSLYQAAASAGAGMIMPIFCLSNVIGMAVEGVAGMFGAPISIDSLGPIGSFIKSRCIGSWGPMDPRSNMLGSGDPFVAAGIASARGMNIAQNITGDMYNKTINNTPFYKLKFNLDWPHQSDCYGFSGGSGLSRGWTTPIVGALGNISDIATGGGDIGSLGGLGSNTVGGVAKQGGYVFTYWRDRTCRYVWGCDDWRGDTGI